MGLKITQSEPFSVYINKHRRTYRFVEFESLGKDFLYRLIFVFEKWIKSYSSNRSVTKYYSSACKFMRYIRDEATKSFPNVTESILNNKVPDERQWQQVCNSFRNSVIDPCDKRSKITKSSELNRVSSFLQAIHTAGLVPKGIIKGISFYRSDIRPQKSAAELVRKVDGLEGNEVIKSIGETNIENIQLNDIIRALAAEGVRLTKTNDLDQQAIDLNKKRLSELRNCAEKDLLKWWEVFQRGTELLALCDLEYKEDMVPLLNSYKSIHAVNPFSLSRKNPFAQLFSDETVDLDVRQGRLLRFIDDRYSGFWPENYRPRSYKKGPGTTDWELSAFWGKRVRNLFGGKGPRELAQAHLAPHPDFFLSAFLILLIDTGLNVQTISDLPHDCLAPCDTSGLRILQGHKNRGKTRPKLAILRTNDQHEVNAVKVIQMVLETTRRYRQIAATGGNGEWRHPLVPVFGNKVHQYLFIRRVNKPGLGLMRGYGHECMTNFRAFLNRHSVLKGIPWTFVAIRSSVGLKKYFDGNLDIELAQTELGHSSKRISSGYIMRKTTKIVLERSIRKFQVLWEAVAIYDIPGAAETLGYSQDQLENLLESGVRSGLGTVCWKQVKAGGGSSSQIPSECNPIEDCPLCDSKRIFPTSRGNLVDLILHHRFLEENKQSLQAANSERWEKVHLPWLALTTAALEKITNSPKVRRKLLSEAHQMADQIQPSWPPMF